MAWEKLILERALREGLVRLDDLVEKNILPADEVLRLMEEPEREKNETRSSTDEPPCEFGRYEKFEFLGEGGMAVVYKAFDPVLRRPVAVKLLRLEDPKLQARMITEARAQASITHPHVCKVYETGEIDGKAYIAMQFIPGKTIKDLLDEITIEQKIRLMRQVADALHAAHKAGLVHRDIKPSNVMVQQSEVGEWDAYVVDFGVVREIHGPALTSTGALIGSPCYMSPEQIRGDSSRVDRRSDVFSMGVTLYEILSGVLPFDGGGITVIQKILELDPPPLRKMDPSIPQDLESIVMKCLEKEPARRYDSARALGDDLQRYLDGEPVLARPASTFYRLMKKTQKHKTAVAISSVALIATITLGVYGIQTKRFAKKQAEAAQSMGQEIELVETELRQAFLIPLHSITIERKSVQEKMQRIESLMKVMGEAGAGPGYYALGKGHFALGEYQKAADSYRKAWDEHEYHHPEVAYALGLALSMRYRESLSELELNVSHQEREKRKREIQRMYRDPATHYLRIGLQTEGGPASYTDALLAYLDGDYEKVLRVAKMDSARSPITYEIQKLAAEIHKTISDDLRVKGKREEAMRSLEEAENVYRKAIEIGESDGSLYEGICEASSSAVYILLNLTGGSPETWFRKGLESCNAALTVNSESGHAYMEKSMLLIRWGQHLTENGLPADETFEEAIQSGKRAVELMPNRAAGYGALGWIYGYKGWSEANQGKEPSASMDSAIQNLNRAIELSPDSYGFHTNLGSVYIDRADKADRDGLDPFPYINLAIQSCKKAIQIDPTRASPFIHLGTAYWRKGNYEGEKGIDPLQSFRLSVDYFTKSMAIEVFLPAYTNYAGVRVQEAEWLQERGQDPTETLRDAMEKADFVLARDPENIFALFHQGEAFLLLGKQEWKQGRDPQPLFRQALLFQEKYLNVDPKDAEALTAIGKIYYTFAAYKVSRNDSPISWAAKAKANLARALEFDAGYSEAHQQMGRLELLLAKSEFKHGRPPEQKLRSAESEFQKAMMENTRYPSAIEGLGEVRLLQAEWNLRARRPAGAQIQEGIAFANRALALNSSDPEAVALRASLLALQSRN